MSAFFVWMVSIVIGTAMLAVTAAHSALYLHLVLAAAVVAFVALAGVAEMGATFTREVRAAVGLRYLGLVWIWTALNLFVTYAFGLGWLPWLPLFVGFFAFGGMCNLLASMLGRAAEHHEQDEPFVRMARLIALAQLAVTGSVLLSLLLGMFLVPVALRESAWAANNLFLVSALALAAISLNVLRIENATETVEPEAANVTSNLIESGSFPAT